MATSARQIQITEQTSRAVVENQLRVGLDVVCYQRGIFILLNVIREKRILKKIFRERWSLSFSLSLSLILSLSLSHARARAFLVVRLRILLFSSERDDCFVF